jgi:hypothetical protein
MANFVNTVIAICLSFVLLVVAPLTYTTVSSYDTAKRLIHNDTTTFLDIIHDKGFVNGQDISDYALKVNTHGILVSVDVDAYAMNASTNLDGVPIIIKTLKNGDLEELAVEESVYFNKGDIIQVKIKEVGTSPVRHMLYRILNLDTGAFEYTMASSVQ